VAGVVILAVPTVLRIPVEVAGISTTVDLGTTGAAFLVIPAALIYTNPAFPPGFAAVVAAVPGTVVVGAGLVEAVVVAGATPPVDAVGLKVTLAGAGDVSGALVVAVFADKRAVGAVEGRL